MCRGSLFINNKLPKISYSACERLGAGVIGGPAKNKDKEAGHQLCVFFLNCRVGFTFEQGTDQGDYRKCKSNRQVTIYALLYCGTYTGEKNDFIGCFRKLGHSFMHIYLQFVYFFLLRARNTLPFYYVIIITKNKQPKTHFMIYFSELQCPNLLVITIIKQNFDASVI